MQGEEGPLHNIMVDPTALTHEAMLCFDKKPWDVRFTREFKEQFFELDTIPNLQKAILFNALRLASGEQGKALMKQLKGTPK